MAASDEYPLVTRTGRCTCTLVRRINNSYAGLLLHDSGVPVNADNIKKVLKASNVNVQSYLPSIFARALNSVNIDQFLSSAGGVAPAAAPAHAAPAAAAAAHAAPAAAAKEAPKKEEKVVEKAPEPEEEEDEDMGFGLFD